VVAASREAIWEMPGLDVLGLKVAPATCTASTSTTSRPRGPGFTAGDRFSKHLLEHLGVP